MLDVRPLRAEDTPLVYRWIKNDALFSQYGMTAATLGPALIRALTDPNAVVLGAYSGPRGLRGFAWFVKNGGFARSGYLRLIVVDPSAKGNGVGRALLTALETTNLVPGGIFLLATDVNRAAHGFYAKSGYRKVGEIPDYVRPGLTEFLFYKPPT